MTINILLALAVTLMLGAGLLLAPRTSDGRVEIVNGLSVFVITVAFNLALPVWLVLLFKDGALTWARQYSDPDNVRLALLYTALGIGSFLLAYRLSRTSARDAASAADPGQWLRLDHAKPALTAAIIIGVGLKVAALLSIGIGPELIQRLSGSARQLAQLRGQEGPMTSNLVLFSTIAEAGAAMLTVHRMKMRRRWIDYAIVTLALLGFTYLLTAKRISVALVAILLVAAVHKYRRPFTGRDLPLALGLVFATGMMTLLIRILAPNYAAGTTVDLRTIEYAGGSVLNFYLYSPEFASFDMVVRAIAQGQTILDALGGRTTAFFKANLEPFLYLIPRRIWPDKPEYFVDLSHGFYVATFGGGISSTTTGIAATLIGYTALLAGPFGVVFGLGSFGLLVGWIDRAAKGMSMGALIFQTVGLILVFQLFRQGSVGWVFLSFVQNMAPLLLVWGFAWFMTRARAQTTAPAYHR